MGEHKQIDSQQAKQRHAQLVTVCSAKGGVGKTVLAVNLAVTLARMNKKVCIIDGDLQFGDVGLALDIQDSFTVKDLVEAAADDGTIDNVNILDYLGKHDSGVNVLLAPERPEYAELVTQKHLDSIIDKLRLQFEYIIVDNEVGLQEKSLLITEKADKLLLVTNMEMTTLKNTRLMLETLEMLGLKEKINVILNRSDMESVIKAADVPSILGDWQILELPNDFQTATRSINMGIPFVINRARTDLAKAVYNLAQHLTGSKREQESADGSFFGKIFNR